MHYDIVLTAEMLAVKSRVPQHRLSASCCVCWLHLLFIVCGFFLPHIYLTYCGFLLSPCQGANSQHLV